MSINKSSIKEAGILTSVVATVITALLTFSRPAFLMVLATVGMAVLKVAGVITISWWLVTAPIWVPLLLVIILSALIVTLILWLT